MAFVQFSRVCLAFGDRDILKDVSLNLASASGLCGSGSRAALAGANGAGKSTLMKVIAGKIQADSGERSVQKGCRVSYLPQSGIVHKGKTLREEAETAYESILQLIARTEELGRELEKTTGDSGRTRMLLEEHHRLLNEIENSGYYRRDAVISQVLLGLGFSESDADRETGEFSGGWQMRIALAKILLENPDIMLLDEPTNYLDIEARTWLESWLESFSGGCLLVSHDRYFLDVTVNEVYEIFQGNLKRYVGNYSTYEKIRAAELESLVKRYELQQVEIEKTEALIRRFRYKATKAAFAQDLIKRLDKMERIEIPENLKKISISFPPPPHSPRVVLTLEGLCKSYGQRQVLSCLDLTLDAGERLLVAGPNGAGKTTLLRIISGGDTDYEGLVKYGSGISVGYFSQDAAENISGSENVEQYIEAEAPTYLIPKVRGMLGAFLFRGDDVFKSLSVLSGGEKSRLAMLRMLLKPMNLLILDEPTNHLDLQSKDILLDCLKAFEGTIIFVSHDRGFMEALSTKTLELSIGRLAGEPEPKRQHRLFYGNYAYYLDRIEREESNHRFVGEINASDNLEMKLPKSQPTAASVVDVTAEPLPKVILVKAGDERPLSAAERREQEKQKQTLVRRLERQEAEALSAMEKLETDKKRLEEKLGKPEVYSSGEKARAVKLALDETATALEAKSREWESIAGELEKARKL
jgi:ATP-binding cassette, subfamily F, member 3